MIPDPMRQDSKYLRANQEYYPVCPTVVEFMHSTGMTKVESVAYTFDEINLPPAFDFSEFTPTKVIKNS
mgnify:CR=1 FL=1